MAQALGTEQLLKEQYSNDEEIKRLIDLALQLEGLYRNASTHAAGVVIGDRPLDELVRYQVDNGVARIIIDRPEAGNALTAAMRDRLAGALSVDRSQVTVRASTTDHLGFAGRGEGAACQAVALLHRLAHQP